MPSRNRPLVRAAATLLGSAVLGWSTATAAAAPTAASEASAAGLAGATEAPLAKEEEAQTVRRGEAIAAPEAEAEAAEAEGEGEAAEEEAGAEGEEGAAEAETGSGSLASLAIGSEASLESFDVPLALLPIYQACGAEYGISWEVLAAINKIETGFGTYMGDSSAGAEGWMQFLPSSWKAYGLDADGDGKKDADDPVDAICAAAHLLSITGGEEDIYAAVYSYNHADWYVRKVLGYAREYERVPANLVNALTELAQGSSLPLAGSSSAAGSTVSGAAGARALAVADATVVRVGSDSVVLRDSYGDVFAYSGLGRVSVEKGDSVAAGEALGAAGSDGAIGFTVRPDGGSKLETASLLRLWRRGGSGAIYPVSAGGSGAAAGARALLLSEPALQRQVLADRQLTLPSCVRAEVRAGELRRPALAALEYLSARGFEVGVAASTCERGSGFAVELASVDGTAVGDGQGQGSAAYRLVRTALAMDGATAPQRVVSATGLAGSETGEGDEVLLDYRPPQKARLVNGRAIAPTGAPAAVQRMIAAANQIADEPYVWGGGHGSWVSNGYDCSGAVSYVLHAAEMLSTPQTSGALESWGESGSGRWVTVYANAEHTYAVIAGLRWDTVGDASGSGPRWHTSPAYPEGFTVRHPRGY